MNEVIANSLCYLTDADAAAMALYIKSLPAAGESSRQTLSADEHAAGQALYDKHCEKCHLSTGRGGFRKGASRGGQPNRAVIRRPSLVNVILYGAKPAAENPNAFDAWEDMSGYKDKMTDTEIAQPANFCGPPGTIRAAECRPRPWPNSVSPTTDIWDHRNRIGCSVCSNDELLVMGMDRWHNRPRRTKRGEK